MDTNVYYRRSETIKYSPDNEYMPPQVVLQTAAYPRNGSSIWFAWDDSFNSPILSDYHMAMHFAELTRLPPNANRSFDIMLNDRPWFGPYSPEYLVSTTVSSISHMYSDSTYNFTIIRTAESTLPPILNAFEIYLFVDRTNSTDSSDDSAITDIKEYYKIEKNWMGDPCLPNSFNWEGLNCSYSFKNPPRITAVNLSSSRLNGSIFIVFAKLNELQYLDLSDNNLTGQIPEDFGRLLSLQVLNLSGNHINGSVPKALEDRVKQGLLILSITSENDRNMCNGGICREAKKKKISTLVIIAVVVPVALLVTAILLVCTIKRRKSGTHMMPPNELHSSQTMTMRQDEIFPAGNNRQFTYAELMKITNNFASMIGKGGFGSVFAGYLENGAPVAVKMQSQSSPQKTKEFLAEAQLLTKVYHRNLVALVDYCRDKNYLSLVYEYMAKGSLLDHLNGKAGKIKLLNWNRRLRIAIEAAQGLDYLHKGCNPPIIHRDVKTSNILLNENLEAKLADFGLSKAFQEDSSTHISTAVVGTLGYLDPEYHITYQLTEKSDLYSFGVVLLELITGQPAIINGAIKRHITEWVNEKLSGGDIAHIVDPRMQDDYNTNSVWKVIEIAMNCTGLPSPTRANMAYVIQQLKETLDLQIASERIPHTDGQTMSTGNNTSFWTYGPSER